MACCKYTAGMLREAIAIQGRTGTQDDDRQLITVWATISGAPTRAMVRKTTGREQYHSDRVEAVSTLVFVTRYSAAFDESARIVHRGRNHNIRSIVNVDYGDQWLEITASLGDAD